MSPSSGISFLSSSLPKPPANQTGWPWDERESSRQTTASSITSFPPITVVTPSFNQGEFLEATIRSVLLQGYPNLQYIVVDGGSTDNSHAILDQYADHLTEVIREPDSGQSDAIVKGLRLASGTFFNWINSDDLLLPGVLAELATSFNESTDLYTFEVGARGDGIRPYTMYNRGLSAKRMLRGDRYSFAQPGLWFRTQHIHECGGIDARFNYGFDWDLLVRYLSLHPRVQYSTRCGAIFRLHPQSKTMSESAKSNQDANRFHLESLEIREKLENSLRPPLRRASLLGRKREPWNQWLVDQLDRPHRSPLLTSLEIIRESIRDPAARFSVRTMGAIARLMSRYVRPKFYRGITRG